ncbi:unnamed protein product [Jaminaea pallidilutea]
MRRAHDDHGILALWFCSSTDTLPQDHQPTMISDVQLSALANWLGSLTMILIVVYHAVGANAKRTDERTARAMVGEGSAE